MGKERVQSAESVIIYLLLSSLVIMFPEEDSNPGREGYHPELVAPLDHGRPPRQEPHRPSLPTPGMVFIWPLLPPLSPGETFHFI